MKIYVTERFVNHDKLGKNYLECPCCGNIKTDNDFMYNFASNVSFGSQLCENNICFDCYCFKNTKRGLLKSLTMTFKNNIYQLTDIPDYLVAIKLAIKKINVYLNPKIINIEHIREKWLNINIKKFKDMMPVNTKSMFSLLCMYMEKLDNNEIDVNQANAMSKLIGQANNLLNYELKRTIIMSDPELKANHRNLELKTFDSLPE